MMDMIIMFIKVNGRDSHIVMNRFLRTLQRLGVIGSWYADSHVKDIRGMMADSRNVVGVEYHVD